MSEATARELTRSRVHLAGVLAVARVAQRGCLDSVAAVLPGQLVAVARADVEFYAVGRLTAADQQALAASETELASSIRAGVDYVRWPSRDDGFDAIASIDVAAAVFAFLAPRVRPLEALVRRLTPGRSIGAVRTLLSPRPFFDHDAFVAVAASLNRVSAGEVAVEQAQRQHDLAVLDEQSDESGDQ